MTTIVQVDGSVYLSASPTAVCYYKIPVQKATLEYPWNPFFPRVKVNGSAPNLSITLLSIEHEVHYVAWMILDSAIHQDICFCQKY